MSDGPSTPPLHPTPGNPVPDGAHAAWFRSRDGRRIRYALVPASGRPLKGTVLVLTGRNEAIEKYFETIKDLSARGFQVACFDWRGQGGSDRLIRNRTRGFVSSFDHYVADLDQFFAETMLPDCRQPFFVLAHSTGALVALLAAPKLANRVRRMVLTTPLLALPGSSLSLTTMLRLGTALRLAGLGRIQVGGRGRMDPSLAFAANRLTSDESRFRRNQAIFAEHPELATGGPTVTWVRAFARAALTVTDPDFIATIRVPILLVAAGADTVVSSAAVEDLARRLRSGSLVTIDGARHEILQEADRYRDQFLAAFYAFVPGEGAGDY